MLKHIITHLLVSILSFVAVAAVVYYFIKLFLDKVIGT